MVWETILFLPMRACVDDEPQGGGDAAKTRNGDFTADDEEYDPCLHLAQRQEHDQNGGGQQFVGERIEQLSEGGDHIMTACQNAVEVIGEGTPAERAWLRGLVNSRTRAA